MNNTVIVIIGALLIGGGGGYVFGKGADTTQNDAKKLQDTVAMMNEQSINIKQMGEMMKAGGVDMQEMGMKYKDDSLVAKGKDLQVIGEKYISENTSKTKESGMDQIMAQ